VVSDAVLAALRSYTTTGRVDRIFGPDRYATAAAVSAAHFSPGVPIAYVATGRNFPDALAGGVAGGRQGGPLLLTEGSVLSEATRAELLRLRPAAVVVLGSAGVVSDAVLNAIRSQVTANTRRIGGADRYETAALVSRSVFGGTAASLRIATGRSFPDAIAATPAAVRAGGPILLVPGSSVPAATRTEAVRLAPSSVVIVGSVGVVNERVNLELRIALGNLPPLPACTYTDVPVIHGAYGDWYRTVLDTVYALPQSYYPGDLVNTSSAGANGGYLIRSLISADMAQLFADARSAGRPLQVVSGFRDWHTQQATFNYWVQVGGYEQALRTSARPGHSEHQLGTTFDVTTAGGADPWSYADWAATPTGAWMRDNAWRYGFVMSYPKGSFASTCYDYEPWHYRYVGRQAASAIQSSGLTPREWLWLAYH
jgi:D-alanyl-D-alanine carboxypeptidase